MVNSQGVQLRPHCATWERICELLVHLALMETFLRSPRPTQCFSWKSQSGLGPSWSSRFLMRHLLHCTNSRAVDGSHTCLQSQQKPAARFKRRLEEKTGQAEPGICHVRLLRQGLPSLFSPTGGLLDNPG